MTVVLVVLLAVNFLLAYLWRSAEAENARLREDLDAPHDYAFVTRGAKAAQPDPDAIMAARLAAHNERPTRASRPKFRFTPASLTWQRILHVLTEARAPMTRMEISAHLDVSTAAMVLLAMVDAGVVAVIPGTRPYQYVLVAQTEDEANTDHPTFGAFGGGKP